MGSNSKQEMDMQEICGADLISEGVKSKVSQLIEVMLEAELDEAIAVARYARGSERQGYRNGTKPRQIHGGFGRAVLRVPRGLIANACGNETEWRSRLLPLYKRRTKQLDAALVSLYFSGTNEGRIRQALEPLVSGAPMSKSTISRVVNKLKEYLDEWRKRDLSKGGYVYVYLDAKNLKVKVLNKVEVIPVLVALGVSRDGQKEVLDLDAQMKEKEGAWAEMTERLSQRGLKGIRIAIIDGNKGLRNAVSQTWPGVEVQRCTVHKLRNLEQHAPARAYEEVKRDYNKIVYAEEIEHAKANYKSFVAKWKEKLPGVVNSLEEAGEELLTFYKFPKEQWGSLRTTNPIERVNLEFKRRVKTMGSLPSQESAVLLLFGLIISGQIKFHKIKGHDKMPKEEQKNVLKENV